jgi:predicted outer membrane repeat protein
MRLDTPSFGSMGQPHNFASGNGGGIFFEQKSTSSGVLIRESLFENNSALWKGGALYLSQGSLEMSFNQFVMNSARIGVAIYSKASAFQNSLQNNFSRNSAS